jgi:hypothetical protein
MRKPRHQPLTIVTPPTSTPIAPPCKLGEVGQALWGRITTEFQVDDAGGQELLAQACLAADRAEALAAIIDRDGEMIDTKIGPKEHPCLKSEMAARSFVVRTLGRLGLNFEAVRLGPGRPPHPGWRG